MECAIPKLRNVSWGSREKGVKTRVERSKTGGNTDLGPASIETLACPEAHAPQPSESLRPIHRLLQIPARREVIPAARLQLVAPSPPPDPCATRAGPGERPRQPELLVSREHTDQKRSNAHDHERENEHRLASYAISDSDR